MLYGVQASERVANKLVELEALRRGEGAMAVQEEGEGPGNAAAAAEQVRRLQAHERIPGGWTSCRQASNSHTMLRLV